MLSLFMQGCVNILEISRDSTELFKVMAVEFEYRIRGKGIC